MITSIINRAISVRKENTIQQTKSSNDYTNRNKSVLSFYHAECQTAMKNNEAGAFKRHIGNTAYSVNVRYSCTSKETISDKITRLVKNDVSEVVS